MIVTVKTKLADILFDAFAQNRGREKEIVDTFLRQVLYYLDQLDNNAANIVKEKLEEAINLLNDLEID